MVVDCVVVVCGGGGGGGGGTLFVVVVVTVVAGAGAGVVTTTGCGCWTTTGAGADVVCVGLAGGGVSSGGVHAPCAATRPTKPIATSALVPIRFRFIVDLSPIERAARPRASERARDLGPNSQATCLGRGIA